jgi:general secretion pathway protein D
MSALLVSASLSVPKASAQTAQPGSLLELFQGLRQQQGQAPVAAPGATSAPAAPGATPAPAAPAVTPTPAAPGATSAPATPTTSAAPPATAAPGVPMGLTTPQTGQPAAAATPSARPAETTALIAQPAGGVSLKFDNADVLEVLQVVLSDILKLDYVIDPAVQGRLTLKSSGAVTLADVYGILEQALAFNNISLVRQGNTVRVMRDATAVRERVPGLLSGGPAAPGPGTTVMQIIPLQYVQANQLVNTLRNFVGAQAAITNDPTNRYLVVVDRAANVEKIVEMVRTLDVDYLAHVQVRVVPLQFAEATEVSRELEGIFRNSGLFNVPGTEAAKAFFLPIVRLNAVMVAAANPRLVDTAQAWIKRLDSEPTNGINSLVNVIPVANSSAAHLAGLLSQIFGGSAPAGGSTQPAVGQGQQQQRPPGQLSTTPGGGLGQGNTSGSGTTITRGNVPGQAGSTLAAGNGLSGTVQVIADEVTNSLIVRASPQDFAQIRKVIERIDNVPRQVLIQVMVAEVTLNDTLQYGVEWWLNQAVSRDGVVRRGALGLEGNIRPPTLNTTNNRPSVTGAGSGLSYAVFNSANQVVGLLNLLGQDTSVNVLSAPHVMATDGKVAKVEVGNDEPIITQTLNQATNNVWAASPPATRCSTGPPASCWKSNPR